MRLGRRCEGAAKETQGNRNPQRQELHAACWLVLTPQPKPSTQHQGLVIFITHNTVFQAFKALSSVLLCYLLLKKKTIIMAGKHSVSEKPHQKKGKINYGSVIQTEFHESSQRSSVSVGKRHQRPRSSLASLVIGTCDRKSPNFWSHQCKQKIQSLMSRTVLLFFCSVCSTMGASPRGHLCVMKKMCVWVLVAQSCLTLQPYGL